MNKKSAASPVPEVWLGSPHPLGAMWDGEGVNFALYSPNSQKVELCLFDDGGRHETARLTMRERTDGVWHGYLPGARPGQLYGYRVHGAYAPDKGHRFNPHKLLLDPYARAIVGRVKWSDAHFGYTIGHKKEDLSFDRRESAGVMPKSQVVDNAFSWGNDRHPDIACAERVIYETHVRGFTKLHPNLALNLQGTYAGLAAAPVIEHLKSLGVTTVELLPIQAFVDDRPLVERGLVNYWGYNTIGFFAPEPRYGGGDPVREFKSMVRTLHSAGLEVILDVVYNHTGEGNQKGPTLCFRGIDNAAYYRLGEDPRFCADFTGCGNTLDLRNPRVLQLVADSLRYWVTEMHVDGFRFDLATALARTHPQYDPVSSFLAVPRQDPVLSRRLLIAEPWDLAEGGYQVGRFPAGWAEWNDQYRDTMRAYWKGDGGLIDNFATRLMGSSDLYAHDGRGPCASVNFITAHDGFTLNDLVSYDGKHNEANGEDNRDGTDNNVSWNHGAEGPTDDPAIVALRERQKRNLLGTLLLSQGVPMILAGDEAGRTQQGNNNSYCQDNEINWLDWNWDDNRRKLVGFVKTMVALRRSHPLFRRRLYFKGAPLDEQGHKDVTWLKPDGQEMTPQEWAQDHARCLGAWLNGAALEETDARGQPIRDDGFLILFNAHHDRIDFKLPEAAAQDAWQCEIDTAQDTGLPPPGHKVDATYPLEGRSLVVLRHSPAAG